jgi:diguanylate cyclase (GGDEF)-like protein
MKYPASEAEMSRILALQDHKILDTDYDPRFDNLVEMVSSHFGMPIALVSLIDADRQWFKAKVGLDARQTPRHHSFCTHAIMAPDAVMVVEDAWKDPRFRDNPLVDHFPFIRFYAGAPIVTASGAALGTVCVIDREPRSFDAADRDMLARFAQTTLSLLELHRCNALLHDAATRDPLTGLLNRRGLEQTLGRIIGTALNGQSCGLLYIDVDHFKAINDAHGHGIGDALLVTLARRLQVAVRQGDLVARFGGDEFVILLAHPVDAVVLQLVAQRVLWACRATMALHGHVINPSVTIGGAIAPRDAMTRNDLLRVADEALYAAKRSGRGKIAIAGNDLAHGETMWNRPVVALSQAIDGDELFLEWQSYHDTASGAVIGYEALVRWNHPHLGRLAPDRFVPLAEACGLSARLDAWVVFHACKEAAQCIDPCSFSINISAQCIADSNMVPLIRAALDQSGLCPTRLVLEMTETAAVGCEEAAIANMRQLKAMGVRLALDDFGTGYSALNCLQAYPFDILKLDRKLVSAICADARGRSLAEGVIHLARLLEVLVVAEGIETQAQADLLSAVGCNLGQGFLWAKSQPAPWFDHIDRNAPVRIAFASRNRS